MQGRRRHSRCGRACGAGRAKAEAAPNNRSRCTSWHTNGPASIKAILETERCMQKQESTQLLAAAAGFHSGRAPMYKTAMAAAAKGRYQSSPCTCQACAPGEHHEPESKAGQPVPGGPSYRTAGVLREARIGGVCTLSQGRPARSTWHALATGTAHLSSHRAGLWDVLSQPVQAWTAVGGGQGGMQRCFREKPPRQGQPNVINAY